MVAIGMLGSKISTFGPKSGAGPSGRSGPASSSVMLPPVLDVLPACAALPPAGLLVEPATDELPPAWVAPSPPLPEPGDTAGLLGLEQPAPLTARAPIKI